jgi:ABC-type antimicrobial peptide transport system ATPase subunit
VNVPAGCSFAPRCAYKIDKCTVETPPLMSAGDKHEAACWVMPHVDTRTASDLSADLDTDSEAS